MFHELNDFRFDNTLLVFVKIKNKLVVYLEDHSGLEFLFLQPPVNVHHCDLDDVGSAALDRGIDGVALRKTTGRNVPGIDIPQVTSSPQDRLNVFFFPRLVDRVIHIALDSKEFLEVRFDDLGRLRA